MELKGKKARFLQMQRIWAGQGPMQKLGDLMVMLGIAESDFPVLLTAILSSSLLASYKQRQPHTAGLSPAVHFLGCSLGILPVSQANDKWELQYACVDYDTTVPQLVFFGEMIV